MEVKTSEDVYNFVKECIKLKENQDCITTSTECEKNPVSKKNVHSQLQKYNLDYSKFDECIQEIEEEEKVEKEKSKNKDNHPNNTNPCNQGHDHSKERQLYEKKTSEKLEASQAFNEEGKQAFHEKKFKLACVYFRKGLIQLDYCFPESESEQKKYNTLEINLHLNLALTKFHMTNYHDCINECNTVLHIDKNNAKAFYRKGQAYMQLDLFDEAKEELVKASILNPNDVNVKNAMVTLKRKVEEYNKRKKVVCSKMFLSNDTEPQKHKKEESIKNSTTTKGNMDSVEKNTEQRKMEKHKKENEKENMEKISQDTGIQDRNEYQKDNNKKNITNNIASENTTKLFNTIQCLLMKNVLLNIIIASAVLLCSMNLFFLSCNYTLPFIMVSSILCIFFLKPLFF